MFGLFNNRHRGPAGLTRPEVIQEQGAPDGAWTSGAPVSWHAPLPELARKMSSASWLRAEDTSAACACCGTPHAGMAFDTSALCITCASVLSFDLKGLDERAEPVWLPFISQAALNRVMGAHLRACRASLAETPAEQSQAAGIEPGKEQFAQMMQDARRAAQMRLGDVSASDLVSAWRALAPDTLEVETAIRFLPRGVWQNAFGRNVFTEFFTQPTTGSVTS